MMYSPERGIIGLWAFWGLSLLQILGALDSGYITYYILLQYKILKNQHRQIISKQILFSCFGQLEEFMGGLWITIGRHE